ncbi:pyridoxamine 5'-phosphate oxidase, partial [Gammaproteobacteria bacterium]|nr:pyridoxamine 5'-phosphate oxidase [Gammaproteobacteria bacterium]
SYWGGFSFEPYYFEFWTGQKFRLNKRESFQLESNKWQKKILQP